MSPPLGRRRARTDPKGPYTPTRSYLCLMIKGAKEHDLNRDYIEELEELYATLEK